VKCIVLRGEKAAQDDNDMSFSEENTSEEEKT